MFAGLAGAQGRSPAAPFRIGLLPDLPKHLLDWVHEAMAGVGWQAKRDYVFVPSGANYGDLQVEKAQHLVAQKVDLILVSSTAHALAAHRATSRVPIVMLGSGYPVEAGLAGSLAHPGKNVTGVTVYAGTGIWGKLLELLREAKPGMKRVGVAWGYVPPAFPREEIEPCYRELRQGADALGLTLHVEEVARPEAVPASLSALDAARPDALLIMAGPGFYAERLRVMQFSVTKRLPTAADWEWPSDDELRPLLTFGAPFLPLYRQATAYVARILRDGARAGDLPIQQPAKFELILNRRTANAIRLALPRDLLLRADRVVES